ncbi:hypothetical protein [Xanthomonas sp. MUS 060]|uniref:hypothetical protein n=1 Tax=Xanthomonas sp. MUS 060 TaxID=1588031 RepID=UPI000A7380CA|nr:hypothetical protein [Xanthomonas sp. MUS 060]
MSAWTRLFEFGCHDRRIRGLAIADRGCRALTCIGLVSGWHDIPNTMQPRSC